MAAATIPPRVFIVCQTCGDTFYKPPSLATPRKKYCSRACRIFRVTKQCEYCGKDFVTKRAHYKRRRFCSASCRGKALNPKTPFDPNTTHRTCKQCGETKPIIKFGGSVKSIGGRLPRCRECTTDEATLKKCRANYYAKHKTKLAEKSKQWVESNRERVKANNAAWRRANAERVKERAKERHEKMMQDPTYRARLSEHGKQYRRENPDKMRALGQRMRARRKQAEGSWTADEFAALCEMFGNVCLACGAQTKLHADHVVPLVKGGDNFITNIQPLCKSCNSRKHANAVDYRLKSKVATDPLRLHVRLSLEAQMDSSDCSEYLNSPCSRSAASDTL